ncbi:putative WD repeat-containing protein [Wickerhamomyces ciferrii]|uniref:WD repeat-containing protein n=1 Tax=Wickerhamomyces ciferrii (strain ATCC 14091 / BCRC 22168 / CBS 111 / JCM 3599 / NBRC 0793 / NRRL Y-1031 F-60-10) TaxID=1206466 RepID=K0KQK1_WICCF|nr:putative WD repeat-containing protein [Wickerhamomyces ciferrii]CCH43538.1 putative WD repeat-containing protein [Wickerhamomyces ciferrii]
MSLIDRSSNFSFSSITPVISPCGQNIAYINGSKLVIRKTETLSLVRVIKIKLKNKSPFIKVSQIQWEHEYNEVSNKIAVLIGNENIIKIYDILDESVDITIIEDDVFGIQNFEWLPPREDETEESAYEGSKQIIVFTEAEISANIYSLDYSRPILSIEKPKFNKILLKPNSNIFSIITLTNNQIYSINLINKSSSIEFFNSVQLSSFLNLTESIQWSPDGQWILCNDASIGGINIQIFSLFNESLSQRKPIFKFIDDFDPLGAIETKWVDNSSILISDHYEQIHYLEFSTGLEISYTIRHRSSVDNTIVWKQDLTLSKYQKKQNYYKIPQISSLPLVSSGIFKFLIKDNYLFSVTKSMPSAVFVWSLSNKVTEPLDVIVTNSKVKDIQLSKNNHLLIVNEDSISIWNSTWSSPLSFPAIIENSGSLVKGATLTELSEGNSSILIWFNDNFNVLKLKLDSSNDFDTISMDTEQFDTIRNGSPALIDDSTNVVKLARGVQQSEWGHNNTASIEVEDTFMNKRRKPLLK